MIVIAGFSRLPVSPEAIERMRHEGRAVPLRHKGPACAGMGFAAGEPTQTAGV